MTHDPNQTAYARPSIVKHYAQLKALQPGEQTVFDQLQDKFSTMKMLDMGVGGGRTTQHFSLVAAEYMGIDYSADMIAACWQRFPELSQTTQFRVCDARDMRQFSDNSFDFILFSFNGIDYVSHTDRLTIFKEVSRVGKPGGYFCFSTHNLQGFEQEFKVRKQLHINPLKTYINLVMLLLTRLCNPTISLSVLKNSSHQILKDESHNFRLNTYYIRPQAQLQQLALGFCNSQVYSWHTGLEIVTSDELLANVDMWLYYLCNIKE